MSIKRRENKMFEDIIYNGRDLKEEIRKFVAEQIQRGIEQSINRGNDEWIVNLCEEEMTKNLDNVVQMYTDFFSPDEIAAILDWNKSDLGIRSAKFNDEKMTPFIMGFFNNVMKRVIERADMLFDDPIDLTH
jgi:hypothetical protein